MFGANFTRINCTEQVFSVMKIVKTSLRSKMEDEFLANSLITYIEKDIVKLFDDDSIVNAFDLKKERRTRLRMPSFSRSYIMIDHTFAF